DVDDLFRILVSMRLSRITQHTLEVIYNRFLLGLLQCVRSRFPRKTRTSVRCCLGHLIASMRPRQITAENRELRELLPGVLPASMRPRQITAENRKAEQEQRQRAAALQ